VVIAIALASLLFLRPQISLSHRIGVGLILGWVWGLLFGLNSWDFISMSAVIGLFWCLGLALPSEGCPWRTTFLRSTSGLLVLPVIALVGMLPFIQSTAGGLKLNYGWVGPNEFNSLSQVLRHVGIFAVPAIAATFILSWRNFRGNLTIRLILAAGFGVLPLALAAVSTIRGTASIPWGIVVTSAVLCGMSTFIALG